MKIRMTTMSVISVLLLAAGVALAQENTTNLTVTDPAGRVLMTNATFTCMHGGRVFFGQGCHIRGFAPEKIHPDLLASLGIDPREVEAKGREDARRKLESALAYQRDLQNWRAAKAIADERAARLAEAEAARRMEMEKSAREEQLEQALRELAGRQPIKIANTAVASSGSVAYGYPVHYHNGTQSPGVPFVTPSTGTARTPGQNRPATGQTGTGGKRINPTPIRNSLPSPNRIVPAPRAAKTPAAPVTTPKPPKPTR